MGAQHVNDIEVERILIERVGPTAVAFLSYGSIPCDHFRPELQHMAEKMESRIPVLWLDADENPSFTEEMLVKAVPTMIVFRNGGDQVARFEGPYSREMLIERLKPLL